MAELDRRLVQLAEDVERERQRRAMPKQRLSALQRKKPR